MNLIKPNLLAALLLAIPCVPATVLADTIIMPAAENAAPAVETSQPAVTRPTEAMELMQKIHTRKIEMMQNNDPAKCEPLMNAQMKDREALEKMGLSAGGMGMMRPGAGMMNSGGPSDCMMARGGDWSRHDDAVDQRLDAMEKRLDMMQMLLQMMLNR